MEFIWDHLTLIDATYILHALRVPSEALYKLKKEPLHCGVLTRVLMALLARLSDFMASESKLWLRSALGYGDSGRFSLFFAFDLCCALALVCLY